MPQCCGRSDESDDRYGFEHFLDPVRDCRVEDSRCKVSPSCLWRQKLSVSKLRPGLVVCLVFEGRSVFLLSWTGMLWTMRTEVCPCKRHLQRQSAATLRINSTYPSLKFFCAPFPDPSICLARRLCTRPSTHQIDSRG